VTPLLAGFYPAIFMAETSVMPLSLLLAYTSTILFGIPWSFTSTAAMCASGGCTSRAEQSARCQQSSSTRWRRCRIIFYPSAQSPSSACSSGRLLRHRLLDDRRRWRFSRQPAHAVRSDIVKEIKHSLSRQRTYLLTPACSDKCRDLAVIFILGDDTTVQRNIKVVQLLRERRPLCAP